MIASEYIPIFGYGSLVNRHARRHDLVASPARAHGWRRSWSHCVETENGNVCALTIIPRAQSEVAGVVILEHRQNLPALDAREKGYQRVPVSLVGFPASATPEYPEAFTYTSTPAANQRGSEQFPIWRSYLECVLAGFLDLGGDAAVRDFVASTDGWETPMLDDRRAPRYMRAVSLSEGIRRAVDALIHAHGLDRTQFAEPSAPLPIAQKPAVNDEFG